MGKLKENKELLFLYILRCIILLIISAICILVSVHKVGMLDSQYAWERWKGDSEAEYTQLSVYLPASASLGPENINSFRNEMMKQFESASIDISNIPFHDAWSCEGSISVTSEKATGTVPVTAVGGSFFDFHPLSLISGHYISEADANRAQVVLDEELAWFLFGSSDVAGMQMKVGEGTFTVAGVVERESDKASRKAYTADMGLFMNFDAYRSVLLAASGAEDTAALPPVSCYEVVMPNPVKNFALNIVNEKFPVKEKDVVVNSQRFQLAHLASIARDFAARAISSGVPYPYWENAARYTENQVASLSLISAICLLSPFIFATAMLIRKLVFSNRRLKDIVIPQLVEKTEGIIQSRQRARYLKKHNQQ